jgi:hypothetical protein
MAQSDYELIGNFEKQQLISAKEKSSLIEQLKEQDEFRKKHKDEYDFEEENEIKKMPYYPLQLLAQSKIYSTPGTLSVSNFIPEPHILKDEEKDSLIHTLSSYANQLYQAKLISAKTLEESIEKIKKFSFNYKIELLWFDIFCTEQEYFLQPKKLKNFVDPLLKTGVINENAYKQLMEKSAAGELRKYDELTSYLNYAITIDVSGMSTNPSEYIEEIHRKTAKTFPDLDFDSLSYKIEINKKESFESFTSYDLITAIKQGNKTYRQKSYFNPGKQNQPQESMSLTGAESYYEIFNKILSDKNSKYRLHSITINRKKFGIIALTKEQFEKFNWMYDGASETYIPVSYENYNNQLTQSKIKKAIALYDSIGLFNNLSQVEKDSCTKEVLENEVNNYSDILRLFENVIFDIDLEYGVDEGQYKMLTDELSSISQNHFMPVDIIDTYNYENHTQFDFGFTLNNKNYKTKLEQKDDWLDTGFWELIKKAVAEQEKAGKFYTIFPSDGLTAIYLTNEQYSFLKANNLLEFTRKDVEE